MREINLISSIAILPKPGTPTIVETVMAEARQALRNGNQIIGAAVAIEKQLETIILLKIAPKDDSGNQFFTDHILHSEAVGFSLKRKLVLQLVNDHSLLAGPDKQAFDTLLRNVMTWRNAFAHGEVLQRGNETLITYSLNGPKELLLSDEFWTTVERTFDELYRFLQVIEMRVG